MLIQRCQGVLWFWSYASASSFSLDFRDCCLRFSSDIFVSELHNLPQIRALSSLVICSLTMSGLVAYGSSDEEDTPQQESQTELAAKVRHIFLRHRHLVDQDTDKLDVRRPRKSQKRGLL